MWGRLRVEPVSTPPLTPEELLQRAIAAEGTFTIYRQAMIERKCPEAALDYCKAVSDLKAARAALPKPRLVCNSN